jgi:hypothetical protein
MTGEIAHPRHHENTWDCRQLRERSRYRNSSFPLRAVTADRQLGPNPFIHNIKQRCERYPGSGRCESARGATAAHSTRLPGRARPP